MCRVRGFLRPPDSDRIFAHAKLLAQHTFSRDVHPSCHNHDTWIYAKSLSHRLGSYFCILACARGILTEYCTAGDYWATSNLFRCETLDKNPSGDTLYWVSAYARQGIHSAQGHLDKASRDPSNRYANSNPHICPYKPGFPNIFTLLLWTHLSLPSALILHTSLSTWHGKATQCSISRQVH